MLWINNLHTFINSLNNFTNLMKENLKFYFVQLLFKATKLIAFIDERLSKRLPNSQSVILHLFLWSLYVFNKKYLTNKNWETHFEGVLDSRYFLNILKNYL